MSEKKVVFEQEDSVLINIVSEFQVRGIMQLSSKYLDLLNQVSNLQHEDILTERDAKEASRTALIDYQSQLCGLLKPDEPDDIPF